MWKKTWFLLLVLFVLSIIHSSLSIIAATSLPLVRGRQRKSSAQVAKTSREQQQKAAAISDLERERLNDYLKEHLHKKADELAAGM